MKKSPSVKVLKVAAKRSVSLPGGAIPAEEAAEEVAQVAEDEEQTITKIGRKRSEVRDGNHGGCQGRRKFVEAS